jgi:hypothetical protein
MTKPNAFANPPRWAESLVRLFLAPRHFFNSAYTAVIAALYRSFL